MSKILTRLFSIRPGEEKKTILLYILHFVFYMGLMWGDYARETFFLDKWSADDLALMFVGNAVLAFVMGLLYTFFADRVSNERLLIIMSWLMMGWLLSVRVLIETHGGARGAVYPYFYLVYDAFRGLSTMHILTYINDFYDTRTAKNALPLMLSAGIAGSTVAGLSARPLNRLIGLKNVASAWIACLVIVVGLIYLIRWRLAPELYQIRQATQESRLPSRERTPGMGSLENLRSGFHFIRQSELLRWLAVTTFAKVVLMNLLIFQSSRVFEAHFEGDPEGLFNFYGIVGGISNVVGLTIQALVLNRLIVRFGVGTLNLLFPSITLLSVGAINFLPNSMVTAVFGRLDHSVIKQTFRNPFDAMLYNSLPLQVKSRAKGFVNGLVVPMGTLVIGFILMGVRLGRLPTMSLTALGLLVAIVYVVAVLRVRTGYSHSLANLLAEDEMAVFHMSHAAFEQLDPATLNFLDRRLGESKDDEMTIFLAEVIYEIQGRGSFDRLQELATKRGPGVRAGIIEMLGADWITDPTVRNLCVEGLKDKDAAVRQAAVSALAGDPGVPQDETLLSAFLELLDDPDESLQAGVIPPLIASGDFYYLAPAVQTLSDWLANETDSQRRALGLRVLARTGAERMVRTLVRYLDDPTPLVRRQAVELIDDLTAQTPLEDVKRLGLETLSALLADDDESVRLAAASGLGHFRSIEASKALLTALRDESFEVRRQACAAMRPIPRWELEKALESDDRYLSECAAFILTSAHHTRARRRVIECMETLVTEVYAIHAKRLPLQTFDTPSARLLRITLQEQADSLLDRVFWLLGALSDESEAQNIRRSLQSKTSLARANAAETLETITSPRLSRLIVPLFDGTDLASLAQIGQETLDLSLPTEWQVLCQVWPQLEGETAAPSSDGWLKAIAIYTLMEMHMAAMDDDRQPPVDRETLLTALQVSLDDESPLVRETAWLALSRLDASCERDVAEESMLTIEKVIFLKEVPFFQGMNTNQLCTLADISEEIAYDEGQQIFAEGEYGDALHVIVSGRVAIQRQKKRGRRTSVTRLATLGPREYFAEMSIFDNEPHSADAVALEHTELLLVRQDPLVALINRQPNLALGFIRVLSQRIRRANAIIAERTRAQPKKMMDVYDKLM